MYFRRAIEGSSLVKRAVPCQMKGPRQWLQAYSSNRLRKIEMRIDPAKPRPLEKKKNMPLNVTDGSLVPITVPLWALEEWSPDKRSAGVGYLMDGNRPSGGKKDDAT